MTPRTELDRLFAESLAKIPTPDAIDCTGVQIGNSDIEDSSVQGGGPNPDGAFTTPGHEHDSAIRGQDWRNPK